MLKNHVGAQIAKARAVRCHSCVSSEMADIHFPGPQDLKLGIMFCPKSGPRQCIGACVGTWSVGWALMTFTELVACEQTSKLISFAKKNVCGELDAKLVVHPLVDVSITPLPSDALLATSAFLEQLGSRRIRLSMPSTRRDAAQHTRHNRSRSG